MELFKILGTIAVNNSEANSSIDETTSKASAFAQKTSQVLGKAGDAMESAGKKLIPVTTAIAGLGTKAVQTFSDFEAKMSKVQAISGATGDDMELLGEKAKEMGAKTKFSAAESADAFSYMAMAGWKTKDMLGGIEGIMNLAAASGEDLATTSDIVTDALTAFGMQADEAGHFADVLAATSANANTNVSLMGETFKYVAPVAGAMGYKVEDVSLAIGLMANSGIKASQAGTSLRTLMTNMAKPTDTVAAAMDALGISLDDGKGKMKPFAEVMQDIRDGFGDLMIPADEFTQSLNELDAALEDGSITQKAYDASLEDLISRAYGAEGAEKARYAAMLAGKTGMSGMLALVNASEDDYKKLSEAISGATDETTGYSAANAMAETMLDNFQGKVTLLKSQLEGAGIQIGEIIVPYLEKFVAKISELTSWFASLDTAQQEQIIKIAALVAALGPALIILGKLTSGIGSVVGVIGKLIPLLAGISAPVLAVVAAIGVLVAAFVTLWNTNEEFRNNIIAIWEEIKSTFSEFTQGIVDELNALGFDFENISDVIKTAWDGLCSFLGPIFVAVFQQISNTFKYVTNTILGVLKVFVSIFKGDWQGAWDGIKQIAKTRWEFISNTWKNILNTINQFTGGKLDEILNKFKEKIESIKTTVKNGLDAVKSFFENLKLKLPDIELPHFKLEGEFSLKPPSVPTIGVDWYSKAMNNPMIMNSPTAFGINSLGQIMAGGEAGSEVVSGTDTLMNMISNAVSAKNEKLENILLSILDYMPQMANMQLVTDTGVLVGELAPRMDAELGIRQNMAMRGM